MSWVSIMRYSMLYEEQRSAMEKVESRIRRHLSTEETGLPSIATIVPPRNHLAGQ